MGENADDLNVPHLFDEVYDVFKILARLYADAVHAGLDLDVHLGCLAHGLCLLSHTAYGELLKGGHLKIVFKSVLDAVLSGGREQENIAGDTCLSHLYAFKNMGAGENIDMAGIGAVQEYGAEIPVTDKMRGFLRHNFGINLKKTTTHIRIPARSWLYAPIKDAGFRKTIYDYVGDEELLEEYADKDIMKQLANIIGEVGLQQIHKAFDNGGINGEWAPNSQVTISKKKSSKPLIDKGDLRSTVMFEVE